MNNLSPEEFARAVETARRAINAAGVSLPPGQLLELHTCKVCGRPMRSLGSKHHASDWDGLRCAWQRLYGQVLDSLRIAEWVNAFLNAPRTRLSEREKEVVRLLWEHGEMYGLEMVEASAVLKRGTVYVTLSRMSDKGLVRARFESTDPRRLYRLTTEGEEAWKRLNR